MAGPDPNGEHQLFTSSKMSLKPEWIDYNGHLNMAYYLVLLDEAGDEFWDHVGLGDDYRAATGFTTYAASCKIDYIHEIKLDSTLTIYAAMLELAEKKFTTWSGIYDQDGKLCATAEILFLHVDQKGETPKVAPISAEPMKSLKQLLDTQSGFVPPHPISRPIELNRPQ